MLETVHKLSSFGVAIVDVIISRTLHKHFHAFKLCAEEKKLISGRKLQMLVVTPIVSRP